MPYLRHQEEPKDATESKQRLLVRGALLSHAPKSESKSRLSLYPAELVHLMEISTGKSDVTISKRIIRWSKYPNRMGFSDY